VNGTLDLAQGFGETVRGIHDAAQKASETLDAAKELIARMLKELDSAHTIITALQARVEAVDGFVAPVRVILWGLAACAVLGALRLFMATITSVSATGRMPKGARRRATV
jgi:hypothetical protein